MESGLITFIQLTIQTTHTFKIEYYNQAINSIGVCLGKNDWKVEVYFIVPTELMYKFKDGHLDGCRGGVNHTTRANLGSEECKWYGLEVCSRDALEPLTP